jgi:magnesium transporter
MNDAARASEHGVNGPNGTNGAMPPYRDGMRALLCSTHGTLQPAPETDKIDQFIADGDNLLWLDIDTELTADLSLLDREFGFHELALEDALRHHQRPKIELYDTFTFIVFYAVSPRSTPGQPELSQIAFFAGRNFLVTVHKGHVPEIEESARRWRANIQKIDRSIGSLLYSLLDSIVDGYFPVVDQVADLVEGIEEAVFERYDGNALEDIFSLKKSLLNMRRALAPERDVLNILIRRDTPLFGTASIIYFQDVYDHVVRVTDAIDIYRDLLTSALDAYLSISSNRLNQVMKTLTSWTIPLMAASLLAGVWGMNFDNMPELDWRFGYLFALSLIAGVFVLIALAFRKRKWL